MSRPIKLKHLVTVIVLCCSACRRHGRLCYDFRCFNGLSNRTICSQPEWVNFKVMCLLRGCKPFQMGFLVQLCSSWQDFNWGRRAVPLPQLSFLLRRTVRPKCGATYVDVACCYRRRSVVCRLTVGLSVNHTSELCKNGWTNRISNSCGSCRISTVSKYFKDLKRHYLQDPLNFALLLT